MAAGDSDVVRTLNYLGKPSSVQPILSPFLIGAGVNAARRWMVEYPTCSPMGRRLARPLNFSVHLFLLASHRGREDSLVSSASAELQQDRHRLLADDCYNSNYQKLNVGRGGREGPMVCVRLSSCSVSVPSRMSCWSM